LGINLSSDTLTIDSINAGGLFKSWNIANPQNAVSVGDRILTVNGKDKIEPIIKECQELQMLNIRVIKFEQSVSEASPTNKGSLGRRRSSTDDSRRDSFSRRLSSSTASEHFVPSEAEGSSASSSAARSETIMTKSGTNDSLIRAAVKKVTYTPGARRDSTGSGARRDSTGSASRGLRRDGTGSASLGARRDSTGTASRGLRRDSSTGSATLGDLAPRGSIGNPRRTAEFGGEDDVPFPDKDALNGVVRRSSSSKQVGTLAKKSNNSFQDSLRQ